VSFCIHPKVPQVFFGGPNFYAKSNWFLELVLSNWTIFWFVSHHAFIYHYFFIKKLHILELVSYLI
jgi:hypothetical protein